MMVYPEGFVIKRVIYAALRDEWKFFSTAS